MRECTPLKQRLHPQLKGKAPMGARKAANAAKDVVQEKLK